MRSGVDLLFPRFFGGGGGGTVLGQCLKRVFPLGGSASVDKGSVSAVGGIDAWSGAEGTLAKAGCVSIEERDGAAGGVCITVASRLLEVNIDTSTSIATDEELRCTSLVDVAGPSTSIASEELMRAEGLLPVMKAAETSVAPEYSSST